MEEAQVAKENSALSSVGGRASASEQIALCNRKADYSPPSVLTFRAFQLEAVFQTITKMSSPLVNLKFHSIRPLRLLLT